MEKSRFIEVAPLYYALAIITHLNENYGQAVSRSSLTRAFTVTEDAEHEYYCYVEQEVLLDRAIEWLAEQDLITVTPDDFGPALYEKGPKFNERWAELKKDISSPFGRYAKSPDGEQWIQAALIRVNREYDSLNISTEDFETLNDEWEPIPLDRKDEKLKDAIAALDETIEAVRSDNGYGATAPEEKAYVLEGLNAASNALKGSETVSVPYLKTYALEPIARLLRRFGKAAVGAAASLSRDSLYTWLKGAGVKGLELLWRMFVGL